MKLTRYNIVAFIAFSLIIFMSVGFALYNQELGLNGNITLKKDGKIEIISASIVESECVNVKEKTTPVVNELNVSHKVIGNSSPFEITYLVEIKNNSIYDYAYTDFSFNASIDTSDDVALSTIITDASTGNEIESGEQLLSGKSKTLKVKVSASLEDINKEVTISGNLSVSVDKSGNILASISPKTGNLQGENSIACFTASVVSTYTYDKKISFSSSNENIVLVKSDGTKLNSFQVKANSTEEFEICTKVANGSTFLTDETTTSITLNSVGVNEVAVGELTLKVDQDTIASDKEIPQVGNVNISIDENNTVVGEATISWDRIDSGGSSIINYYIILYNSDTSTTTTYQTNSDVTSYKLTNISEGNYYVKVYGEDEAGNIGKSYCASATNENGYCSLSNTTLLKWEYTITYSLTNLKHDDVTTTTTTAILNSSFSTTLQLNTSSTWYSLPSSVTVKMGEKTLTRDTDYTYTQSSGLLKINKITGDVTITASATGGCLIKGTKITLANNNTKNIEDISYNDLLLVWNYETGTYTYEYPIWIEKSKTTSKYKKITFSDGSILKTYGEHGVFSRKLNKYVSVNDNNNFKIGTEIVKINNNKISYTKVSKIEMIYESTEYYHVVSTRYYNIIANDILTTDGTVILSNLYNFNNSIKWENRNYKNLDLYNFKDFNDIMPYYMYQGLRVEEGKVLSQYISLEEFKKYLLLNQLNDNMILKPKTDSNGNRLWMVTTSDDIVTNKNSYLKKENEEYLLKEPVNKLNFKYWYNTADGKKYKPNDKVKVIHGMHFVAVYEK